MPETITQLSTIPVILITLGCLFLLGLVADLLGTYTPLPRVTLLLLSGLAIGPSGLDLLPPFTKIWFPALTVISLSMIGFLLGQNFTMKAMRELGRPVLMMSVLGAVFTAFLIFIVLFLCGVPLDISLLLAGIAPATAPAATMDIVHEYESKGKFTEYLLDIVAIDDAWGLLVFSFLLAIAQAYYGGGGVVEIVVAGACEIGGAILLGLFLGVPMVYLTGQIRPGEPTQAEALGLVLLSSGLAVMLQVSYILTAMTMGMLVANMAKHHERPFNAIEGFEWPFLILFFLLAGATLEIDAVAHLGGLGLGYILLRTLGKILGTLFGGWASDTDATVRRWMGFALLPQAGVAIGMALLAGHRFPDIKDTILTVIIGSSVVFELLGPPITRKVLKHVGDIT